MNDLPLVIPDLLRKVEAGALPWQPFHPGVEIHRLYGPVSDGPAAALLRYHPGAVVPQHEHGGHEHIWVLVGSQQDERGTYHPGTLVINPPGTVHTVRSPEGCVVLVIWERPVRFLDKR